MFQYYQLLFLIFITYTTFCRCCLLQHHGSWFRIWFHQTCLYSHIWKRQQQSCEGGRLESEIPSQSCWSSSGLGWEVSIKTRWNWWRRPLGRQGQVPWAWSAWGGRRAAKKCLVSQRSMWFQPTCPHLPVKDSKMEPRQGGGQRADARGTKCRPGPWADQGLGTPLEKILLVPE